jgi:hypothetical protein
MLDSDWNSAESVSVIWIGALWAFRCCAPWWSRGGEILPIGGLRQRSVLAALLIDADRGVEINQPIEHVWHNAPQAAHLDSVAARGSLRRAEQIAKATGETVWDTQLSARKFALRADSMRSGSIRG